MKKYIIQNTRTWKHKIQTSLFIFTIFFFSFSFLLCEKKKGNLLPDPSVPPVKSRKMKGLLGINYSRHLAGEEDYEDAIPADYEDGGDKNNCRIMVATKKIVGFLSAKLTSCVHYR